MALTLLAVSRPYLARWSVSSCPVTKLSCLFSALHQLPVAASSGLSQRQLPRGNPFTNIRVFPLKGFGGLLIEADVTKDLALQVRHRCEDAPVDDIALELGEPVST